MKHIAIFLAASVIPLSALPASAQSWNNWGGRSPTAYVDGLQWQIDTAAQQGRISWQQHRWLQRDLNDAKPLAYRVETDTASSWERNRLDRDVSEINRTIHSGYRGYYRNYNNGWQNRGWNNDGWRH
jgi:hypothetical protein